MKKVRWKRGTKMRGTTRTSTRTSTKIKTKTRTRTWRKMLSIIHRVAAFLKKRWTKKMVKVMTSKIISRTKTAKTTTRMRMMVTTMLAKWWCEAMKTPNLSPSPSHGLSSRSLPKKRAKQRRTMPARWISRTITHKSRKLRIMQSSWAWTPTHQLTVTWCT